MYNQIKLPKGKFLGDIMSKLPSNKIIYKGITGCGATSLEIKSQRSSILIEPYIPVILGKSNKDVFAVYGGVNKDDIVEYLTEKRPFYKFVSTPEGLSKILDACKELEIDPYKKFFFLVDECEKLVQDVDYRPGIIYIMSHFFKFRHKSFISATPIRPTDPRFDEHNIEVFNIYPEEENPIAIDLYTTNNLASTTRNYFRKNKSDNYCIFINSTNRIASIIDFLQIENESSVFCAQESIDKLKAMDKEIAFDNWSEERVKKYNFFTSRFFTAFDMILESQPNVLIISDVKTARHSALDPNTDIIQIVGRARKGVNHIAHISNWEGSLKSRTELEIRSFLKGSHQAYNTIKQLLQTTNDPGASHAYQEALKLISFSRYIDIYSNDISHFMIDNEIQENIVNGYYKSPSALENAYLQTERFSVNHIKERYNLEDEDLEKLEQGISEKRVMAFVCETIHKHFEEREEEDPFIINVNHAFNKFIATHKQKYAYYRTLGIEMIRELKYCPFKIDTAYNKEEIKKSPSFIQLQLSLLHIFKSNRCFSTQKITKTLNYLFNKHNVRLSSTLKQLKEWFIIRRTTVGYREDGSEIKEYKIIEPTSFLEIPKFRH